MSVPDYEVLHGSEGDERQQEGFKVVGECATPRSDILLDSQEMDKISGYGSESSPTQCEDMNSAQADQDLHQLSTQDVVFEQGIQRCLDVEGADLPVIDDGEAEDLYVEEKELGLSYKDENTKGKSHTSESESEESIVPLEISIYLKAPWQRHFSYQRTDVYMLHNTPTAPVSSLKNETGNGSLSADNYRHNEMSRFATFTDFPSSVHVFTSRLSKSGFVFYPNPPVLECCFCKLQLPPEEFIGVVPDILHKRKSPDCPHMSRVVIQSESQIASDAASTPRENIPVPSGLSSVSSRHDMASTYQPSLATMYPSLNVQGNITAASITISTSDRQPQVQTDSVPMATKPTDSTVTSASSASSTSDKAVLFDTTSQAVTPSSPKKNDPPKEKKKLTYADLGIFAEKPKRPEMAVVQKRLQSFQGKWKPTYTQTPTMLADAGMYYAGYGDCARCFFCGGGLKNWEPPDSPWIEHARWFPKCGYVRMSKGQAFVDIVQKKNREKQEITLQEVEDELSRKDEFRVTAPVSTGVPATDSTSGFATGKDMHRLHRDARGQLATDLEALETQNEELKSEIMCKICMDEESAVVFLPCGHLVSCTHCSHALRQCPLCRAEIKGSVRAYMG